MIKIFLRIFSVREEDLLKKNGRKLCGIFCSVTGIFLNMILFIVKLIAGRLSGSVAITVDAVHNLTDCASSVVTLISFLLSGSKSTKKFPMGKGRAEYIAGFVISSALMMTGFELAKASVMKIINPEPVNFSVAALFILIISVVVKIYMASYGFFYGKKISSAPLKASATDCLCDSFATLIAAGAVIISAFSSFNADAWGGLSVSLFILFAATKSAGETVALLMGKTPEDIVEKALCAVYDFDETVYAEKIFVDDFGPEKRIVCMKLSVDVDMLLSEADALRRRICAAAENDLGMSVVVELKTVQ